MLTLLVNAVGRLGLFFLIAAILGCNGSGPRAKDFTRTALGRSEFERAFAAGEKVMRGQFGRISGDAKTGLIESEPSYFHGEGVGADKGLFRRRAQLKFVRRGNQWWAYLRVLVERLDSRVYQQFQHQRSGRDYEPPSPMEADLTAGASRRQVWSRIQRRRDLERELLSRLNAELGIVSEQPRMASPKTDSSP